MKKIFFYCETDGLLDKMTKVHCIAVAINDGEVHSFGPDQLSQGVDELCQADLLIGHNLINFDLPALAKFDQTRHMKQCESEVYDTLIVSRLLWPDIREEDYRMMHTKDRENYPKDCYGRHSLKAWGYRLGMLKGLYLQEHGYAEFTEDMADYCRRDVEVVRMLYQTMEGGR